MKIYVHDHGVIIFGKGLGDSRKAERIRETLPTSF